MGPSFRSLQWPFKGPSQATAQRQEQVATKEALLGPDCQTPGGGVVQPGLLDGVFGYLCKTQRKGRGFVERRNRLQRAGFGPQADPRVYGQGRNALTRQTRRARTMFFSPLRIASRIAVRPPRDVLHAAVVRRPFFRIEAALWHRPRIASQRGRTPPFLDASRANRVPKDIRLGIRKGLCLGGLEGKSRGRNEKGGPVDSSFGQILLWDPGSVLATVAASIQEVSQGTVRSALQVAECRGPSFRAIQRPAGFSRTRARMALSYPMGSSFKRPTQLPKMRRGRLCGPSYRDFPEGALDRDRFDSASEELSKKGPSAVRLRRPPFRGALERGRGLSRGASRDRLQGRSGEAISRSRYRVCRDGPFKGPSRGAISKVRLEERPTSKEMPQDRPKAVHTTG